MLIKISKSIEVILENEEIKLTEDLKNDIDFFWKELIEENPCLWDGEDVCVQDLKELENKIIITCQKTKYSHYLYDERIGIPNKKYKCSCLWGGILLKTKDKYFVLGEMAESTSVPHCLQISGGGIDKIDLEDGKINIVKSIERELKEELNLELNNLEQITDYKIKYLEVPEARRNAYGVIAVGNLNMTKQEMEEHYKEYLNYLKDNKGEIEFKSLKFIPLKNATKILNNLSNPKRIYLNDLLDFEEQK